MIYNKILQRYVPIRVEKTVYEQPNYGRITKYIVKDGKIPVGRVSVSEKSFGVYVEFMEKLNPNYSHFGEVADQIEVEHGIQQGWKDFEIRSNAALNSHAMHYLRGKRFLPESINEIVKSIIENTPLGEKFRTIQLGSVKMYMPKELIKKYIELAKKNPLLK